MTTTPQPPNTTPDVRERHLTGRPVTVRPMTRRWISEVPSKMVKIFGRDFQPTLTGVCPDRSAYGSALHDRSRRLTTVDGRLVLPRCSHREQPETPEGWRFVPPYDPTTYEPDGPAPPSLARRAAVRAKTIVLTAAARTLALTAVLVIARHALLVYGGR